MKNSDYEKDVQDASTLSLKEEWSTPTVEVCKLEETLAGSGTSSDGGAGSSTTP